MLESNQKKSLASFSIEYYLPFYLVLTQYKFGPLPLGDIGIIICAFISLRNNKWKININNAIKPFVIFIFYVLIRDIIRILFAPDFLQSSINSIISIAIYSVIVISVCSSDFNENKLYKTWKIAGAIYIFGLLYHLISIFVFKKNVVTISLIPGYEIRPEAIYSRSSRPLSFFAEPASFVTSMIPLLFMSLRFKEYKWAVVSTVSILASTSTVGVVLCIVLWTCSLISKGISLRSRVSIIVIATLIVIAFSSFSVFNYGLSKALDVADGGGTFGSRVLAGFEIIRSLNFESLLFGSVFFYPINYVRTNISSFSSESYALKLLARNYMYLSAFSNLIFSYGLIGLILFIIPYVNLIRHKNYKAKMYVVVLLVGILGERIYLNVSYFMTLIILFLYASEIYKPEIKRV